VSNCHGKISWWRTSVLLCAGREKSTYPFLVLRLEHANFWNGFPSLLVLGWSEEQLLLLRVTVHVHVQGIGAKLSGPLFELLLSRITKKRLDERRAQENSGVPIGDGFRFHFFQILYIDFDTHALGM
jgi:hypothetical protein